MSQLSGGSGIKPSNGTQSKIGVYDRENREPLPNVCQLKFQLRYLDGHDFLHLARQRTINIFDDASACLFSNKRCTYVFKRMITS